MLSMMNFQPNWLHMVHSGAFSYNLFCFYSNPRLIAHFAVKPHPPSPPFLFPLNVFPKSTNLTGITSRWWMLGNSKHWMCGWTSDQQVLPEANIFGLWITMFWNFFISPWCSLLQGIEQLWIWWCSKTCSWAVWENSPKGVYYCPLFNPNIQQLQNPKRGIK